MCSMKVFVISGFLGAGKTTFIQALSERTAQKFVVMENEYGGAGIDGAVLQKDRLKIWELTEGCICCSLKSDFASSILTIVNTLDPEYLIVEPTGVGLLSAVLQNIGKIEYERIRLLEPLTVVDIHSVEDYLREFGEIYADQIKNAPRIVLSKTEQSSSAERERITAILRELNPHAEILSTPYQNQPDTWWQELLQKPLNKNYAINAPAAEHSLNLETVSLNGIRIESVQALLELLVALLRGYFGAVYRVKGFAPIGTQWTKFDIADRLYTITVCEPMQQAQAVIIGQNLDRKRLKEAFQVRIQWKSLERSPNTKHIDTKHIGL